MRKTLLLTFLHGFKVSTSHSLYHSSDVTNAHRPRAAMTPLANSQNICERSSAMHFRTLMSSL